MSLAGIKVIAYSEKEKYIQTTHEMNFSKSKLIGNGDITKTTDKQLMLYKDKIHFIFAGFPCQGFSQAGKKSQDDPRNTLFREFIRTTRIINPHVIIGENVKGLLSRKTSENKNYIDVIVNEFEKLNYSVIYNIVKCEQYCIPQKRERLLIIGIRNDVLNMYNLSFPCSTGIKCNITKIIDHYDISHCVKLDKQIIDMTYFTNKCIKVNNSSNVSDIDPHPYIVSKINATDDKKTYNNKFHNSLFSYSKRDSPLHCEIVNFDNPSKTIICTYEHQSRLVVPIIKVNDDNEIIEQYVRCFNPTELKRIQSFPKSYKINGNVKQQVMQIGNAVPPLLIFKIAHHILNKK
jgi:DNA (cytosine-5)-methyltransferase 1